MTTLLDQAAQENNEDPQDQYETFKPRDRAIRKSDGFEFLIFTVEGDLIAGVGRHPRTGEAVELPPTHRKHFRKPEIGPKQGAPITIKPVPVEREPEGHPNNEETQPVPTVPLMMHENFGPSEVVLDSEGNKVPLSSLKLKPTEFVPNENKVNVEIITGKSIADLIDDLKAKVNAVLDDDAICRVPVHHEPTQEHEVPITRRKKVQARRTLNITADEYAQMLNDGWEAASQAWHVGALNVMWVREIDESGDGGRVTLAEAWLSGKYSSSELQALAEQEAEALGLPVLWAEQQNKNGQTWESLVYSRRLAQLGGL